MKRLERWIVDDPINHSFIRLPTYIGEIGEATKRVYIIDADEEDRKKCENCQAYDYTGRYCNLFGFNCSEIHSCADFEDKEGKE